MRLSIPFAYFPGKGGISLPHMLFQFLHAVDLAPKEQNIFLLFNIPVGHSAKKIIGHNPLYYGDHYELFLGLSGKFSVFLQNYSMFFHDILHIYSCYCFDS